MNFDFTVGVVGNPNCGKTTLFNALTGARQHVGNWPGVTVERKTGEYSYEHKTIALVDLPGTYSLESSEDAVSLDEKVARDYVASREADVIINIIDASNIERNLYLSSQLIEMRVPMIVALNMMDTATHKGIFIDADLMAERLGCPVIPVTASIKKGIDHLKKEINQAAISRPTRVPPRPVTVWTTTATGPYRPTRTTATAMGSRLVRGTATMTIPSSTPAPRNSATASTTTATVR